jgi:hypothetical protein
MSETRYLLLLETGMVEDSYEEYKQNLNKTSKKGKRYSITEETVTGKLKA